MAFHIVLVEPEIPANTGNIVRTCAATGTVLHLVHPLGFDVSDKQLKRAGLDYWAGATVLQHNSYEEVAAEANGARFFFASTKSRHTYTEAKYRDGDYLVFGKETKGLPEKLLHDNYESCIRIPMLGETRSLNLSNSVAIVLYEALRQLDFPGGFTSCGKLREYPD